MSDCHDALLTIPPPTTAFDSSIYNSIFLTQRAHWIRNTLDPLVAREGENALHADDVLELDDLLRQLLHSSIGFEDLRRSRIHLAVLKIGGRATRWPHRLVERCEEVKKVWEKRLGVRNLADVGIDLFGEGGRLHGVCEKGSLLEREALFVKWLKDSSGKFSPSKSLRVGDLGFVPGDWWINALFACRDGIINYSDELGRICTDNHGAYAIVLAGSAESNSPTPESFTYRARPDDKGRYRLTAATPESRAPVRILRHHSLQSFWAPRAGLRYDGLHKVSGWKIRLDPKLKQIMYHVSFVRLPDQPGMDSVLCRPWVEEVEDYGEYKRLRQVARQATEAEAATNKELKRLEKKPTAIVSAVDGAMDFLPLRDLREDGASKTDGSSSYDANEERLMVAKTRRSVSQGPSASVHARQDSDRHDSTCLEERGNCQ